MVGMVMKIGIHGNVGIEQNFLDKCQLVKKHIDDLKLRIERLEASPGDLLCMWTVIESS